MKKTIIMIIIILVIIFLTFFCFNKELKLIKIGYSIEEVKNIKSKIKDKDLDILTKLYLKNINNLFENDQFKKNNFSDYINYYKANKNAPYNIIILLVNNDINVQYNNIIKELINHKDFKQENLKRYLEYYQKNNNVSIESVINLVNKDIDKVTMVYSSDIDELVNQEYFKSSNLIRYTNYKNKNPNLNYKAIITNVNSNLDYDYYTNVKAVDLSKGNLILVNKYYKLDSSYVPDNLVTIDTKYGYAQQLKKEAYEAFVKMADAARKEGLGLYIRSPYRSYNVQLGLYQSYVNQSGKKEADTYSARAGYSEHQTGLALDVMAKSNVNADLGTFESTKEFYWIKDHCYEYGFILRYPKGKEYITGYIYEPWHYRYVGVEVAKKIKELDITYEEYYEYFVK